MDWLQYGALGVLAFGIYVWNKDSKETLKCVVRAIQENTRALSELRHIINDVNTICPLNGQKERR